MWRPAYSRSDRSAPAEIALITSRVVSSVGLQRPQNRTLTVDEKEFYENIRLYAAPSPAQQQPFTPDAIVVDSASRAHHASTNIYGINSDHEDQSMEIEEPVLEPELPASKRRKVGEEAVSEVTTDSNASREWKQEREALIAETREAQRQAAVCTAKLQKITQERDQLVKRKKEAITQVQKHLEEERLAFKAEMTKKSEEIRGLSAIKTTMQDDIVRLKSDLNTAALLQQRFEETHRQLEQLRQETLSRNGELSALKSEYEGLETVLQQLNSAARSERAEELERVVAERAAYENKTKSLSAEIAALNSKLYASEKARLAAEHERDNVRGGAGDAERRSARLPNRWPLVKQENSSANAVAQVAAPVVYSGPVSVAFSADDTDWDDLV